MEIYDSQNLNTETVFLASPKKLTGLTCLHFDKLWSVYGIAQNVERQERSWPAFFYANPNLFIVICKNFI